MGKRWKAGYAINGRGSRGGWPDCGGSRCCRGSAAPNCWNPDITLDASWAALQSIVNTIKASFTWLSLYSYWCCILYCPCYRLLHPTIACGGCVRCHHHLLPLLPPACPLRCLLPSTVSSPPLLALAAAYSPVPPPPSPWHCLLAAPTIYVLCLPPPRLCVLGMALADHHSLPRPGAIYASCLLASRGFYAVLAIAYEGGRHLHLPLPPIVCLLPS